MSASAAVARKGRWESEFAATMNPPRSSTATLHAALNILARDLQTDDGVANAAIAEAAQRLAELSRCVNTLDAQCNHYRTTLQEIADAKGFDNIGNWARNLAKDSLTSVPELDRD